LADEYRVKVEMKAGPFEVQQDYESVLKKDELAPPKR
jgi:hypothetical protein